MPSSDLMGPITWLGGVGAGGLVDMDTMTDPALDTALTTAKLDTYHGVIITTVATSFDQTFGAPTTTTPGKRYWVINNDTSALSFDVIGARTITIDPGEAEQFMWDGDAWIHITAADAEDITFNPASGYLSTTNVQSTFDAFITANGISVINDSANLLTLDRTANVAITNTFVIGVSDNAGTNYLKIGAGGNENFVITEFDKVGIGTVSPVSGLDVHYDGEISAGFGRADDATNYIAVRTAETQNNYAGMFYNVGSATVAGISSLVTLGGIRSRVVNSGGALQGTLEIFTNRGDNLTQAAIFDEAGNMGLGVIPADWDSSVQAMQIGGAGSLSSNSTITAGGASYFSHNAGWIDGSPDRYEYLLAASDEAAQVVLANGTIVNRVAVAGTAGNEITWITALSIANTGASTFGNYVNIAVDNTSTNLQTNSAARVVITNTDATSNNFSDLAFYNSNGLVSAKISGKYVNHATNEGELHFFTRIASGAITEALVIGSDQNATFGGDVSITRAQSAGTVLAYIYNSEAASVSAHAELFLETNGAGGGDPKVHYQINGQQDWVHGIDNNDADEWKLSASAALGTTDKITAALTADGLITLLGGTGGVRLDNTVGIGTAPVTNMTLKLGRTISSGATLNYGVEVADDATLSGGTASYYGIHVAPVDIDIATSAGTTPLMAGMYIAPLAFTGNDATHIITKASSLYIEDAPESGTGIGDTWSIYVASGDSAFLGKIYAYGGIDLGGGLEAEADSGAITLFNMPVTSAPSAGDEMSASIMIDSEVVGKFFALADGTGGISNKHFIQSVNAGITADTGSAQGGSPLGADINEISTCANAGDSVTLPSAVAGMEIFIVNNGANSCDVFPASGDNLGAGVDTASALANGSNVTYVSYDSTNWETK